MSEAFQAIDLITLDTVCGGEGGQNTDDTTVNAGITVPTKPGQNVQIGVQGVRRTSQSNYAVCVQEYRRMGGGVDGLRAACGLPNGQP